jgi:hypothetical protein
MVAQVGLLLNKWLSHDVGRGVDLVLSSDEDCGEVSFYDLCYAIIHRIDYVMRLGIKLHAGRLSATPEFKWTAVHAAVITSNDEALRALIAAKAGLDAQDAKGWSALHFTALLGRVSHMEILLEAGADQTCASLSGGTFRDVARCLAPVEKDDSTLIPLLGEDGKTRLTHGGFKRMTGAVFVHETQLIPMMMLREWENSKAPEYEFPCVKEYASRYRDLCMKPPVHCLKLVTHDSQGRKLTSSPGLGVFASCDHQQGAMMGEYRGFLRINLKLNSYTLGDPGGTGIDAQDCRNEIPCINDGFPNVILVPLRGVAGLSTRDLFAAASDIKAGEELCWNYGFNPSFKLGSPYAELRPQEARDFIKRHPIEELYQCIEKATDRTCSFDELCIGEKFRYILQTPSVIFLMIFDGTISAEVGERFLKTSAEAALSIDASSGQHLLPMLYIPQIAQNSIETKQLLAQKLPCLTEKFDQWINSLPARTGMTSALGLARLANVFLFKLVQKFSNDTVETSEKTLLGVWDIFEKDQCEKIQEYLQPQKKPK